MSMLTDLPSGKPLKVFLYKFIKEIVETEYPYLYSVGDVKKGLALYPNIILKWRDLGEGSRESNFKLCIGQTYKILEDQMTAMGVNNILVVDDVSSSQNLVEMFRKYKMTHFKVSSHVLDKEY